ncbi:MAG: sugar transferase, partial [Candidatus Nomurabacteria bacterium]|nr:sugar transferase [Candidatus Nomurabacteria bacterium]
QNRPIFPAKLVPFYGLIFSVILLSLERGILYFLRYLHRRKNIGTPSVVVVGDNDSAADLAKRLGEKSSGYRLQAVVGDRRKTFTTHKTFASAVKNFRPDIIVQISTAASPLIDDGILDFARKNFVDFKFVPGAASGDGQLISELFAGVPALDVRATALTGWSRVIKRTLDIFISGLGLILLSWLFLIIFVLEKIGGHGSAIFRQVRLTRGDHKFQLYKFRSQLSEFDGTTPEEAFRRLGRPQLIRQYRAGGDQLDDDPRVTRLGKFLRRTSLDELPQLWNVLKGDLSLVGPRALVPEELKDYAGRHTILNVKSGITGLAQISGRRDLPWQQRRRLDIYYVQNWRFSLDIQIIFKTIWQILSGRGAK